MKKKICPACIRKSSVVTRRLLDAIPLAKKEKWKRAFRNITAASDLIDKMDDLGCIDEKNKTIIRKDIDKLQEDEYLKFFFEFVDQIDKLRFAVDRSVFSVCERESGE